MRQDMHKVIIERPRRGSYMQNEDSLRLRKDNLVIEHDNELSERNFSPKKISIRPKYSNRKEFSDFLSPLIRYLQKQVGRPWDKVYSEIRSSTPKGTIGEHLESHLFNFVILDAYRDAENRLYYDSKNNLLIPGDYCVVSGIFTKVPRTPNYIKRRLSEKNKNNKNYYDSSRVFIDTPFWHENSLIVPYRVLRTCPFSKTYYTEPFEKVFLLKKTFSETPDFTFGKNKILKNLESLYVSTYRLKELDNLISKILNRNFKIEESFYNFNWYTNSK